MTKAIGIRLPESILKKIDLLDGDDRSTIIRELLLEGYKQVIKKKSASRYIKGLTTISQAAKEAELTIWEMQQYLVSQGFVSSYSIADMERGLALLENVN